MEPRVPKRTDGNYPGPRQMRHLLISAPLLLTCRVVSDRHAVGRIQRVCCAASVAIGANMDVSRLIADCPFGGFHPFPTFSVVKGLDAALLRWAPTILHPFWCRSRYILQLMRSIACMGFCGLCSPAIVLCNLTCVGLCISHLLQPLELSNLLAGREHRSESSCHTECVFSLTLLSQVECGAERCR